MSILKGTKFRILQFRVVSKFRPFSHAKVAWDCVRPDPFHYVRSSTNSVRLPFLSFELKCDFFRCSLYTKAIFMGYQRSRHVQVTQNALLKVEGVVSKEDADFYLGKRVAYIYKVSRFDM